MEIECRKERVDHLLHRMRIHSLKLPSPHAASTVEEGSGTSAHFVFMLTAVKQQYCCCGVSLISLGYLAMYILRKPPPREISLKHTRHSMSRDMISQL